jgi:hypothetical protein
VHSSVLAGTRIYCISLKINEKKPKNLFFFLLDNKAKTNKNKNKQKLQEEK